MASVNTGNVIIIGLIVQNFTFLATVINLKIYYKTKYNINDNLFILLK